MFLFDAHLDLAMNAMEWNRDLRLPVATIREREMGMLDKPDRGKGTVSLPALHKGHIGLVVATQIARCALPGQNLPGWHSPAQAWAQTQAQLQWYREMETCGEMALIDSVEKLDRHLELWKEGPGDHQPIGYILSLEGADSLVTPDYVHTAYDYGLRAIGPAHYGPGRYANGTDAEGGLNEMGRQLLREMESLNIILDATHLCDDAFWEAMDLFNGTVWASHTNSRALVNHNRQFSDEMIKVLLQKNAVIGTAFDAWMMVPDWKRGVSDPLQQQCSIGTAIAHIDRVCQIAGNSLHAGIGSDLDGAFGTEQSPYDLDTIADLQTLSSLLQERGYSSADCENIFHKNWLRMVRAAWA